DVVLWTNLVGKLSELYFHSPANAFPVLASTSKLQRFRAFPCVRLNDADRQYPRVREREDQVARRRLTHRFIERITGAIGIALGRPQVTACDFLAVGLVLVHPPVAHIVVYPPSSTTRQSRIGNHQRSWPVYDLAPRSALRRLSSRF